MAFFDNQEVNFEYGFALRGDRQVERGLDSIMQRFIRTGSLAETSALAVEKFGRIFEVGLPIALGAAGLGLAVEGIYNVGEEAIKTQEKISKMLSIPVSDMDVSSIESNLSQIGDELEDIGTEHGKKYGEGFLQSVEVGFNKIRYNAGAGLANNIPGGREFLNGISFLTGNGTPWSTNNPSYDQAVGNTGALSRRARESMAAIDEKNQSGIDRLSRNEMVSLVASQQEKPDTWQSKSALAHMRLTNADTNVKEDEKAYGKASDAYSNFQSSIAGGGDLTQDQIQEGTRLQKLLNETHRQLIEDTIAQDNAVKESASITHEMNKFRKGDVVASSGRRIGGGGNVYSALHPSGNGAYSDIGVNHLKDFNDALQSGTSGLKSALPQHPFATPTF